MPSKKVSPADYVIQVFGGISACARALNRVPSAVAEWRQRRVVPSYIQAKVLSVAKQRGLPVTAENIILGGRVPPEFRR